jgi:hypothetical protein
MFMKRPENDVALHDGEAFMVESTQYKAHLKARAGDKQPVRSCLHGLNWWLIVCCTQKSKCSKHKAVNQATSDRKALLEVTGIGACACARHSFFVPGSVVDFQKGERQANMDYALCSAMSQMKGVKSLLFCYDVACQWCINFKARLRKGASFLPWSVDDLTVAVGKFHLGAHIEECFALYSANFILGAGQIDGENLEPLWAPLNKSFPAMRGMQDSFRRQCIDWLMNESNWEKLINIGMCLYFVLPS